MRPGDDDHDLPRPGEDDDLADGLDETVPHGAFATGGFGDGAGEEPGPEPEVTVHDPSPLDDIAYVLDEVGDVLSPVNPFDEDPADVSSDSDLDLDGDGVVDHDDLHTAWSAFDLHHGGHEGD